MKCTKCNHEQDSGKFCGSCGNALIATNFEGPESVIPEMVTQTPYPSPVQTQTYQAPAEPNVHVEKVKETSKQYWTYFLQYLKKPSSIFDQPSSNFVHAFISIILFALILTLSLHKNISLVASPLEEFSSFIGQESVMPSFISILFSTLLTVAVLILLGMVSVFLISKFFGNNVSFKDVFTLIGTLLIPFIVIGLVAYILLLIGSLFFGNVLLVVSFLLSIYVMPLFVVSKLLAKTSRSLDSFYAYLAYIVLFLIGFSIIATVLVDSTIGNYLSDFGNFF